VGLPDERGAEDSVSVTVLIPLSVLRVGSEVEGRESFSTTLKIFPDEVRDCDSDVLTGDEDTSVLL
jgi:hypothetical protein